MIDITKKLFLAQFAISSSRFQNQNYSHLIKRQENYFHYLHHQMVVVTQENLCIQKIESNTTFLYLFRKIPNIRIHLKMSYYLQTEF